MGRSKGSGNRRRPLHRKYFPGYIVQQFCSGRETEKRVVIRYKTNITFNIIISCLCMVYLLSLELKQENSSRYFLVVYRSLTLFCGLFRVCVQGELVISLFMGRYLISY